MTTSFADRNRARVTSAPPVARRQFRFASFNLLFLCVAGLIVAIAVAGIFVVRQKRRFDQTQNELHSLRQSASELEQQRHEIAGQLAKKVVEVQQTTLARDAETANAARAQAELAETKSVVATLTTQSAAARSACQSTEAALRDIVDHAVDRLTTLGATLVTDPVLSRSLLREAEQLAERHHLNSGKVTTVSASLATPAIVPPGSTINIVGVSFHEGAWVIDFVVTDRRGQFVTGLGRGDIEVLRGDRRLHAMTVVEIMRTTGQHDVAILLDTSSSTSGMANDAMKSGAIALVQAVANPSRVRVWRFADVVESVSPWTFDPAIHEGAIQALTAKGGTNLFRCIRVAAEDLVGRPGLRSIILFTDGTDSFRQESVDAVLAACRSAEIPVHVVALQTQETNDAMLRRIVDGTGGTYHVVHQPERLIEQFKIVAESFARPVYRARINESLDAPALTMRLGGLSPVLVKMPR